MRTLPPGPNVGGTEAIKPGGHEVIIPPSTLRDKALRPGVNRRGDLKAIERAEKALELLSCNFEEWMREEVKSLLKARARYKSDPNRPEALDELVRVTHDLKGQASTLQYPYVTKICMSLCCLFEQLPNKNRIPMILVDQHVDAANAVVREGVRMDEHPTAEALVKRLSSVTAEYVASVTKQTRAAEATAPVT